MSPPFSSTRATTSPRGGQEHPASARDRRHETCRSRQPLRIVAGRRNTGEPLHCAARRPTLLRRGRRIAPGRANAPSLDGGSPHGAGCRPPDLNRTIRFERGLVNHKKAPLRLRRPPGTGPRRPDRFRNTGGQRPAVPPFRSEVRPPDRHGRIDCSTPNLICICVRNDIRKKVETMKIILSIRGYHGRKLISGCFSACAASHAFFEVLQSAACRSWSG